MPAEKTLAIVLRVIDFSETSCVVTLFTRDFGKISALAKGARRPKNAFEAALDLLAVCRIVFLHKSSDTLDLLTEARLERRFRAASRDLTRLYAGYYFAELLQELTDTGDPHRELFDAADDGLRALEGTDEVVSTVLRLEMLALRHLGHLPVLDACAACGTPLEASGTVFFGHLAGGLLCPSCRVGQRQVVRVHGAVIKILGLFANVESETWRRLEWDRRICGELRGLLNHYLAHLIGHRLRMHRYLQLLAPETN